jgi:hypothetical protein
MTAVRVIRATVLAVLAVLVVAGCGGGSENGDGSAVSTPSHAAGTPPAPPGWVPRKLLDRVVARGPLQPGCGIFYDGRQAMEYDLYVSGGARCRTGLLVLAAFDAGLSKTDLTTRCGYRLCAPRSRTYRGYRCRLVHQFDDDYEFVCRRGGGKVSFAFGG